MAKSLEKVEGGLANMARRGQQGLGTDGLSEFKDQQNTLFLSSAENVVLINNVHPAFRYSYDFADS